jgi:hypothetical protein
LVQFHLLLTTVTFSLLTSVRFIYRNSLKTFQFTQKYVSSVYYSSAENEHGDREIHEEETSYDSIDDDSIDDDPFDPLCNLNVTPAIGPGIYAIVDDTSGKVYFGESNEMASRLGHHIRGLEQGTSVSWSLTQLPYCVRYP